MPFVFVVCAGVDSVFRTHLLRSQYSQVCPSWRAREQPRAYAISGVHSIAVGILPQVRSLVRAAMLLACGFVPTQAFLWAMLAVNGEVDRSSDTEQAAFTIGLVFTGILVYAWIIGVVTTLASNLSDQEGELKEQIDDAMEFLTGRQVRHTRADVFHRNCFWLLLPRLAFVVLSKMWILAPAALCVRRWVKNSRSGSRIT